MRSRRPHRRVPPRSGLTVERLESRTLLSIDPGTLPLPAADALPARQVEHLTRGVNAISTGSSRVYVNWRLLGTDPAAVAFNVYRTTDGAAAVKRNASPITATTDFTDTSVTATQSNTWFVRPVINGVEGPASESFTLPANSPVRQFRSVPLQIPPAGVTPAGESYTYSAGDTSAADLDGDGEYELVVKWDPSNAKDNSQSGYTGNVYLDAYELDGTRLWRIDLGHNIRAGAHYTQFIVYDFDGDGRAEMGVKTAPGTIDGAGQPVLLGTAKVTDDHRNTSGYVLAGPEYLTVFEGLTGRALATANYNVPRGTVSEWGDGYGNRVDRFLAGVGYFDGQRPSLLMCRGYYTRSVLVAWDFRDGRLTQRWTFDTGNSTSGPLAGYRGQGTHSLTIGDVDADGRDEVVYGAMTVDHDGAPLYTTGYGHGDALHMSDMVPSRPGLEVYQVHESEAAHQGKGGTLRDAATGALIAFVPGTADVGRGCAFDIDPRYPGFEMWNSSDGGLYAADGTRIQDKGNVFQNFGIWWDGDPLRELLDGTTIADWRINLTTNTGGRSNYVFAPAGLTGINGTKNTPCLTADLYGDWREEVVWRTSDSSALQIWSTTITAQLRLPTLMHDTQYRTAVAWQNVAYNQPPHTSYFIGQDMTIPPPPNVYTVKASAPPTVAQPATPAAAVVAGTSTAFSALGADDGGEAALTYAWAATGPAPVAFSTSGTNAARNTTATFSAAGVYAVTVTITDATLQSVTSSVQVTVAQTPRALEAVAVVAAETSQQLAVRDQFGAVIPPASFAWSTTGGSVSPTGLFTAPASGLATVRATVTGHELAATVTAVAPRAWYAADQASGPALADAFGDWDASLSGGHSFSAGRIGRALTLTGGHGQVNAGGLVAGLGDFTIAAWVNPAVVENWARIFDFGTGTAANMFLTVDAGATNALRFAITTGGSSREQRIDGPAIAAGTWTHVAVSLVGSTGTLFVNGAVAGTNAAMTLRPADLGLTTQNYLGRSQYADPVFRGGIDDVRIYGTGLSAPAVAAIHAVAGRTPATEIGIDVAVGQTVTDATVRGGVERVVKRGGGTLVLGGPNGHAGGTVVVAGELVVRHPRALGNSGVEVRAGATLTLDGVDASVAALALGPGGLVDLGSGRLTIEAGGYSLPQIRNLLQAGPPARWRGVGGFVSGAIGSSNGDGVGYVIGDDGSITMSYAAAGDTNLDGVVDILDVSAIVTSGRFNSGEPAAWADGDFNHDGTVDVLDVSDLVGASLFNAGPYRPPRSGG